MGHESDGKAPGQAMPPNAIEWLLQVANQSPAERARWGQAIDRQLRSHPTIVGWMRSRRALRDTPHFARYRGHRDHCRYDRAVSALGRGAATAGEYELVTALSSEIATSPLILRPGQVLLCGEIAAAGLAFARYNPFLWTTLHPISAARSAEAKPVPGAERGKPTVYVLSLERSLPALLGRADPRGDWDMLLPRRLRISVTSTHEGHRYDVREGTLGL